MLTMADDMAIDTRVSAEGRVVIPSAVRQVLGVGPGDLVRFVVEAGQVRLVTAQLLMLAVWANNRGGDGGDPVEDIRRARTADQKLVEDKWDRVAAQSASESRSEEEIEAGLLAQLGLTR
jgi:AbrB family looped-hinge helix DNA binding protein